MTQNSATCDADGLLESDEQAEYREALLHGQLSEVDCTEGAAQLHDFAGRSVRLCFEPSLAEEMQRLGAQKVEVRGEGCVEGVRLVAVHVAEIRAASTGWEPFGLDSFLRRRETKPFTPEGLVKMNCTDEGGGPLFSISAFDDIWKWQHHLGLVDNAITAVREAQTEDELASAKRDLILATSRARDHEGWAIEYLKTYGGTRGVDVPGVGRVEVVWLEDWTKVLEVTPFQDQGS